MILILSTLSCVAQNRVQFMCNGLGVSALGFQLTAGNQTRGYTTDAQGNATLEIPKTCTAFRIQFQDITYGNFDSLFYITTPTQEFLIPLTEKQTTIDEVRVAGYVSNIKETARGREYKINTEKFVSNTPIPKALQRLPDFVRSADGVVIAGKTGAPIYYLDDKEVSETVIKALNIQSVERVEVRDVSADPSKDGGEIRIYRKKTNDVLLNGRISLKGRYEINQDDRLGYSTAPMLSLQSPRIEVNATGRYIRSETNYLNKERYVRSALADSISQTLQKQSDADGDATLLLSYLFSKSFSAQLEGALTTYKSKGNRYLGNDYLLDKQNYDELAGNTNLILRYSYSNHTHLYLKGSYGNIQTSSSVKDRKNDYRLKQNDYTALGEFSGEHNELFTLWKLSNSINYAYRYILRGGTNEGTLATKSTTQRIVLEDYIDAPLNISLFLGCAADYDVYDYGIQQLALWNILPTVSLGYGANWGRITLSYAQRVRKPNIGYLDPRVRYSDHRHATIGNQTLLPSIYHSYNLRYSKRITDHSFSFRLEYLDVRNYVAPMYENDNFVAKYYNVGTMQRFAPRISYQGDYFDGKLYVNIYAGMNYTQYAFYNTYLALSRGKAQKGWNTVANISLEYSPIQQLTLETWLGHWGRSFQLYDYRDPVADLGISFRYSLLEKQSLELSASADGLLYWTMKDYYRRELYSFIETEETKRYPSITIGIAYRFGRRFRSRSLNNEIEIDDQLDRIR